MSKDAALNAKHQKNWYYRNRDKKIALMRNKRDICKQYLDQLKNIPCMDCGQKFPQCAMDFDHRPDEKKAFLISQGWNKTRQALDKEILKCDIVCSNCHRIRTYTRGYWIRSAPPKRGIVGSSPTRGSKFKPMW